jgi:hypothetical protein
MWASVRHSCGSRQRRMTARLEVLDRRTLLSGVFPDGRHAIHIGGTTAAGPAQAWIDTKGATSRGDALAGARLTNSTIFGGTGDVRIGAHAMNNPLYGPSTSASPGYEPLPATLTASTGRGTSFTAGGTSNP